MKITVRNIRSTIWVPLEILAWLGLPIQALRPVVTVTEWVDRPFRKYLSGGQL